MSKVKSKLETKGHKYIRGIWRGCCHSCNRASSVAGLIDDEGLCTFCRDKGHKAWW